MDRRDSWISKGVAFEKAPYGKHIIVSDIEHPYQESFTWLRTQGFEVDYARWMRVALSKVDAYWLILRQIRPWSLSWPSTMRLAPSAHHVALLEDRPTISFHVICSSFVGSNKFYLQARGLRPSLVTNSAGLRGVGLVYIKRRRKDRTPSNRWRSEKKCARQLRNVAGIAATAKAYCQLWENQKFCQQTQQMKEVIRKRLANYQMSQSFLVRSLCPSILTFGIKGSSWGSSDYEFDIYISTTSTCSSRLGKSAGTWCHGNWTRVLHRRQFASVAVLKWHEPNRAILDQVRTVYEQTWKEHVNLEEINDLNLFRNYDSLWAFWKEEPHAFRNKLRNNIQDVLSIVGCQSDSGHDLAIASTWDDCEAGGRSTGMKKSGTSARRLSYVELQRRRPLKSQK